jgi:hypothetical protein
MNFAISWVLGLFKKPEVEVTFEKAEIKSAEAWPFPMAEDVAKTRAKRRAPAKKVVAKKATKVAKKKTGTKKR